MHSIPGTGDFCCIYCATNCGEDITYLFIYILSDLSGEMTFAQEKLINQPSLVPLI